MSVEQEQMINAEKFEATNEEQDEESSGCLNMESVHRIAKLPVVESTLQTATNIYFKVKDYNSMTQWTLSTAEGTVHKAVEIGNNLASPVVSHLQQPIKKVDGLLCTGLDYVEEKMPAIKLPPGEMYSGAKGIVNSTVESARHYVEPAVESAKHYVGPAVSTAKHLVEPAMETAKHYVEPAVEKAKNFKDYGVQQVDKLLHSQVNETHEAHPEQKKE